VNAKDILENGKKLTKNNRNYIFFPHNGIQVVNYKNNKNRVKLKLFDVRFVKPYVFFYNDFKIYFVFQIEKTYVGDLKFIDNLDCIPLEKYFLKNKNLFNTLVEYSDTEFPKKLYDLKLDPLKFLLTKINYDKIISCPEFYIYYESNVISELYKLCSQQKILKEPKLIHKSFVFEEITTKWQSIHNLFDQLIVNDKILKVILNE
jgi:hypothetical protein